MKSSLSSSRLRLLIKSALSAPEAAALAPVAAAPSGCPPHDGAGLEVAELGGLNSGRGRGQVQERGRGSGSKSGSMSTSCGASAMAGTGRERDDGDGDGGGGGSSGAAGLSATAPYRLGSRTGAASTARPLTPLAAPSPLPCPLPDSLLSAVAPKAPTLPHGAHRLQRAPHAGPPPAFFFLLLPAGRDGPRRANGRAVPPARLPPRGRFGRRVPVPQYCFWVIFVFRRGRREWRLRSGGWAAVPPAAPGLAPRRDRAGGARGVGGSLARPESEYT